LRATVGRFLSLGQGCSAELAFDVLLEAQETVLRARIEADLLLDVDCDCDCDCDCEWEFFEDEEDE
jgi:hypothetical protein